MTLIGSYVDRDRLIVSVSIERTREGEYLVVKDRWRSPLMRDGASVELEVGSPGNARLWAEADVLARGGQLRLSVEALLCGDMVRQVGEEALEQSRRKNGVSERFVHVPAPGFGGG